MIVRAKLHVTLLLASYAMKVKATSWQIPVIKLLLRGYVSRGKVLYGLILLF